MRMWNIMKCVCTEGFGYRGFMWRSSYAPWCSVLLQVKGVSSKQINNCACDSVSGGHKHVATTPPWKVLFFGTDSFAEESLKMLFASRQTLGEGVVKSLEVVTLPKDLPVRRFALQNKLYVHDWPNVTPQDQFDVGVVVSFGCLLKENLICQFPYGILNVHPSLLPRWRGPAPIFHTVFNGDDVTGVTIMQIRPRRFDVGPIVNQCVYRIPENSTADQLGETLAKMGAKLLIDTLKNLPECVANRREQSNEGRTSAPKISVSMSWIMWDEHTCEHISRLSRAISSRIPLRTLWMGQTIKLLDFAGSFNRSRLADPERTPTPGAIRYEKESDTLVVRCKDGWVGFKAVMLKKRLTAADFYNGYLHQFFLRKFTPSQTECQFHSNKEMAKHLHPGSTNFDHPKTQLNRHPVTVLK